jgi:hypothetical protein
MTDKPDHTTIAALGQANRDSDASVFSAAARRRWATPRVILGTMQDAEGGANPNTDGPATISLPATNS